MPQAQELTVPKLILQPLIENSIYHGIRKLETTEGTIVVRGTIENGQLIIDVIDNGPGFSEEERMRQEYLVQHPEKRGERGIGLSNVYQRLTFCYGRNISMEIISKPFIETIVRLKLPIIDTM